MLKCLRKAALLRRTYVMFVLLSIEEDEMQKHLWNVTQGQRLASLSAARSASQRSILEGVTATILSKSESYGCGQLAGQ